MVTSLVVAHRDHQPLDWLLLGGVGTPAQLRSAAGQSSGSVLALCLQWRSAQRPFSVTSLRTNSQYTVKKKNYWWYYILNIESHFPNNSNAIKKTKVEHADVSSRPPLEGLKGRGQPSQSCLPCRLLTGPEKRRTGLSCTAHRCVLLHPAATWRDETL